MSSASVPIRLPRLTLSSGRSLESVLRERRSVREYSGKPLTRDELAQLLRAAQGVTGPEGVRTGPSAGAAIALSAVYERTSGEYGGRGVRYVHMEVGHTAQNVCLQATALGLGAVVVGAFEDGPLKRVLGLARDEEPLALVPVWRPL